MQARHLMKGHNLNIINPKEIMLHKIIGEGSFGRVWSGHWRSSSVAVKEFVFAQAAISGGSLQRNELIEEIVGEAAIMSVLQHPRILHLYGCSLTSQAIWIVSELCPRGSLRQVLDDRGTPLAPRARLRVAVDVAEGMLYLHSREEPVIHRDLKSHNIFMMEDRDGHLQPKIGDWGSARALALYTGVRSMTHGVGTTCWLAPEVIKDAKSSEKADVYAFGILLWELATREQVYSGLSAAQIIDRVANQGLRPKAPRGCPWSNLMVKCWQEDPLKRPDFREIVDVSTALLETMEGAPPNPDGGSRSLENHGTESLMTPVTGTSTRSKGGSRHTQHHRHKSSKSSSKSGGSGTTPRSLSSLSSADGAWGYTTISSNNSSLASGGGGGGGGGGRSSKSRSKRSSSRRHHKHQQGHPVEVGTGGGGGGRRRLSSTHKGSIAVDSAGVNGGGNGAAKGSGGGVGGSRSGRSGNLESAAVAGGLAEGDVVGATVEGDQQQQQPQQQQEEEPPEDFFNLTAVAPADERLMLLGDEDAASWGGEGWASGGGRRGGGSGDGSGTPGRYLSGNEADTEL
ncbi:unnamed protein product [Ectocarpus fasciculatus]